MRNASTGSGASVSDSSPLPDCVATNLELWLHQHDGLSLRSQQPRHGGQDLVERDEGHIDGYKIDAVRKVLR